MANHHHHHWIARTIVAAAVLGSVAAASSKTFTIAGVYELQSGSVPSASRIDLDQTKLATLLSKDNDIGTNDDGASLARARSIYEHGMHCGAFARLKLTKPLSRAITLPPRGPRGAYYSNDIGTHTDATQHGYYGFVVVGTTDANDPSLLRPIRGSLLTTDPLRTFRTGTTPTLNVAYPEGSTCNVDGRLDDCFAGPTGGLVLQGYGAIDYTYDPNVDNQFAASLKGYSEEEGERMLYCELHGGCESYTEYQRFYDYYGILDYGHHWIHAAFSKESTVYSQENQLQQRGNVDFSLMSQASRNGAIATATVAMNVFTRVNRLMIEMGIDGCNKNARDFSSYGQTTAMESVIGAWDLAASTYAGSALIAETTGSTNENNNNNNNNNNENNKPHGSLYFDMVRTLADDFGVLERYGETNTGTARSVVNRKVFEAFETGREALKHGECDGAARDAHQQVIHLMRVPWIQGVLKAAFLTSDENPARHNTNTNNMDNTEAALDDQRGRGAAYAAALLPDLHRCSPAAAETVYNEFQKMTTTTSDKDATHTRTPDYETIRNALEHQYQCLGVTCDDVGGFLAPHSTTPGSKRSYYKTTRPCGGYGTYISQRRESVAYDHHDHTVLSDSLMKSGNNYPSSRGKNYLPAAFFVALVAFCASLAVLFATVNEHARRTGGRRIAPGQLVSAVASQADYWMGGIVSSSNNNNNNNNNNNTNNSNNRRYDYVPRTDHEVQLQPMATSLSQHDSPVDSLL